MPNVVAIRKLFLHPAPEYTPSDAAALLGVPLRDVRDWMDEGQMEKAGRNGQFVVPWAEVASFALDFWSQEVVEEALGTDLAKVIPELLQLAKLEVRLPRMHILTLERLAAREGETLNALLARELRDLVSAHSEWLSREVEGFAKAFAWPEAET